MTTEPTATPPLCERCWCPVLPGQRAVRFGHIRHADLRGNVTWAHTWLHRYSPDEGCVTAVEPGRVTS